MCGKRDLATSLQICDIRNSRVNETAATMALSKSSTGTYVHSKETGSLAHCCAMYIMTNRHALMLVVMCFLQADISWCCILSVAFRKHHTPVYWSVAGSNSVVTIVASSHQPVTKYIIVLLEQAWVIPTLASVYRLTSDQSILRVVRIPLNRYWRIWWLGICVSHTQESHTRVTLPMLMSFSSS